MAEKLRGLRTRSRAAARASRRSFAPSRHPESVPAWRPRQLAQLRLVSWTRRGDTVSRDADRVSRRLIRNLPGRRHLVLHDRFARNRVVLDALPPVLAVLEQQRLNRCRYARQLGPSGLNLMGAAVASSLRIYLIRHRETAWTITRQHGRTDIPLTAAGSAARALGARLNCGVAGPHESAPAPAAANSGFGDRADSDPDLQEWDYGAYEGRRTTDIRAEREGWRLFEDGCPGGESATDVGTRADRVIARIRASAADVLLFGHCDMLRVLAVRWVDLPPGDGRRLTLGNDLAQRSRIRPRPRRAVIHRWNDSDK